MYVHIAGGVKMLTFIAAIMLCIFGMPFFGLYLIVGKNQAANKGLGIVLFIIGLLIWAKYGLFS